MSRTKKKSNFDKIYNHVLSEDDFSFLHHHVQDKNEQKFNHIHGKDNFLFRLENTENSYISYVSFDKNYGFYTFLFIPLKILFKELVWFTSWLMLLLALFNVVLYLVFHYSNISIVKNKRDMQAIIDHSPAVIYIRDTKGRYVFINQKFERFYNIKRSDVINQEPKDIFSSNIVGRMTFNDSLVLEQGKTFEYEEDFVDKDQVHTFITVKFPLLDHEGNRYAMAGISTDITERKQQEEILRNSQKMEAMGKLTGGIAHDFNNMLGIVLGYSELLKLGIDDKNNLSYIEEIEHAAQRGANLTKKLLSFTKNSAADKEVVELNMFLKDEQNILEKTLTARINFSLEAAKEDLLIWVDRGDLEDAILNITINAMHAIKESGKYTITTEKKSLDVLHAKLIGIEQGDYAVLNITDTGCGMDEITASKIFDPFYSTKGTKGTGLGLSQVYGFMARNDGKITVTSEVDRGAKFSLYFPIYKGEKQNNEEYANIKEEIKKGSESVLVVDDEPALVELTTKVLADNGYTVLSTYNARQALEILKTNSIDLMISDIVMPNMDGFQLAAIVQKEYPSIKIQLVSGYSSEYDSENIDVELKNNILDKPFDRQSLLKRIRNLLDES